MLNKIVNIVLLIACLCFIVSGSVYVTKEVQRRQAVASSPRIEIGQTLSVPETLGKTTLIMELWDKCPHCVANEPLYRKLSSLRQISDGSVQVVAVVQAETEQTAKDFMAKSSIPGKLVISLPGQKLPLPWIGTPTLLLLDTTGKVVRKWYGELTEAEAQEFLSNFQ